MTALDIDHLQEWLGRTEKAEDVVTPGLAERLRATLAGPLDLTTGQLPLCAHWCLAPVAVNEADIGADGHPAKGGFLPPVPLSRRMWAGGSLEFIEPIEIGDTVTRTSTISSIDLKEGRSGTLVFVGVDHEISTARGVSVRERQNIVYRDAPKSAASTGEGAKPAADPVPAGEIQRAFTATTLLMFRYSALTFNGHRIHYDKDYTTQEEGYPDLVFHGPLQATLLVNMAAELAGKSPGSFEYKGVAPAFANDILSMNANSLDTGFELWTADSAGQQCMVAKAVF